MGFTINRGATVRPQKVVLYGPEGVGKTTLAACFPSPLFIDTESGSEYLDVARLPAPTSWQMLLDEVEWIRDYPYECGGTLVIDTADWAQQLAIQAVCSERGFTSIEDAGYGKGYTYVVEKFSRLLDLLGAVNASGLNVVVTAHAVISKFEQPDEMGAYDRWSLKLIDGKKASIAAALKEWADAVLFANYKTVVVTTQDGKKSKAYGGKNRMLYCSHAATWDAKNRWGLADEVPMDFAQVAPFIPVPHIPDPRVGVAPEPVPAVPQAQEPAGAQQAPRPQQAIDLPTELPEDEPAARVPSEIKTPFDEQERPAYQDALWELMAKDGVSPETLSRAIFLRGYMPDGMPVSDYPEDFSKWLVAVWGQIRSYIEAGMPGPKEK